MIEFEAPAEVPNSQYLVGMINLTFVMSDMSKSCQHIIGWLFPLRALNAPQSIEFKLMPRIGCSS